MEYVLRAGRSLGNGMCRAASALARGTRRILAYVPLLGITAIAAQDAESPTGGEDAENATATASSPEEKSAASSPSADEQVAAPIAATEPKEEAAAASPTAAAAVAAAASPVEEKKKEPTPSAPTPVPSVEDKKEEAVEKVEAEKKVVENAPEVKAPVENNIAHDVSTTENVDEAPKVAPPAIPIETPASPPTAPAITEDVASVTKAIEEIDISDKAVAAAVNEVIECNTNEIIADAQHQNINE